MTASNQANTELKQKLIRDTKAHNIGLALLEAFETNAPLTFEERMKAHVLVAAQVAENGCKTLPT